MSFTVLKVKIDGEIDNNIMIIFVFVYLHMMKEVGTVGFSSSTLLVRSFLSLGNS